MDKFWYRYEDTRHATINEWGDVEGPSYVAVYLRKYELVKETPKGAWIRLGPFSGKRFVLREARKRFACPTIEEAKESFIARKTAEIRHNQNRINHARRAIDILPSVRTT
jgi:hypothetical protein